MPPDPPASGAQSIRRALAILRVVAAGRDAGLSLQQVTEATGLSRPTTHRILRALVAEGVAEQSPRTRRYLVGEQISLLALARPRRSLLEDVSAPVLDRAARELGDTVFLTVRTRLDTVCLARRLGSYPIQVLEIEVGARRPLGVSSAGLAMLATLEDTEVEEVLRHNAARLVAFGTDPRRAAIQVAAGRARGHILQDPGLVPGTKAISVPMLRGNALVGVLTVAAIHKRLASWRQKAVVETLKGFGGEIMKEIAFDQNKPRHRPG